MYNKIDVHMAQNKSVKLSHDAVVADLNKIMASYTQLQERIVVLNKKKENDNKYNGMLNYSNLDLGSSQLNYNIMLFLALCLSIGVIVVYRKSRN